MLRRKATRMSSSTYSKREPMSIFTVLIAERVAITVCYSRRENFTVVHRSVLIWALSVFKKLVQKLASGNGLIIIERRHSDPCGVRAVMYQLSRRYHEYLRIDVVASDYLVIISSDWKSIFLCLNLYLIAFHPVEKQHKVASGDEEGLLRE